MDVFYPSVAMMNMGRGDKSSTAINRTCGKVMSKIAFTYKPLNTRKHCFNNIKVIKYILSTSTRPFFNK